MPPISLIPLKPCKRASTIRRKPRKSGFPFRATARQLAKAKPRSKPFLVSASRTIVLVSVQAVNGTEPEADGNRQNKDRQPYDENTAFNLYLKEVGQTELLTQKEEIALAKKIREGDPEAREHMIKANLRLVIKIARAYEDYGMPLLDLINEGNMGLMRAVERFEVGKGAKVSTYAAWWIKQSIKRALANQSKTIRLPVHVVDKLFNMRKVSTKLAEDLGRDPTDAELAEEMGWPDSKVAALRQNSVRPVSLDADIAGHPGSDSMKDIIPDENAEWASDALQTKQNAEMIEAALQWLPSRERCIIQARFGLDGTKEKTLEQVGAAFGLTRERIRQIQAAAMRKMRTALKRIEKSM